jgi:hypothetical protein
VLSVWVADRLVSRRVARRLARFAAERRIGYSQLDRFNLASRVRSCLPHPGAAEVIVRDVMYRTDDDRHAYVFTATYLTGTTSGTTRHRIVGAVEEPRGRSCDCFGDLRLADASIDNESQYASLLGEA